ncbi:hypothetical protein R1sor_001120 [Riccia sorocarpa]|uniref:Reverse transcriptase domain-containing protein n=1 Tax=Riccia sorocarpa TaxID=122646 RepID=A0ABD3GVD6_9MARC
MDYNGEGPHAAEDARVWVHQLQITSKHYGWTEEEILDVASMSLRGCAATWYSAIERRLNRVRNPRVRLDEFHKEFADRFIGASDTNITRQILNIEQKQGENTRRYADRLQSLANRLEDPLPDHVLRDAFVSGLQNACRTHLINRAPRTLQGAIKFAVDFQSRYGERNPYQESYMSTERRSRETTGKLSTQDKSEYGKVSADAGIEPKILKQLTRQQEAMEAQLRSLRESIATMGAREGKRNFYRSQTGEEDANSGSSRYQDQHGDLVEVKSNRSVRFANDNNSVKYIDDFFPSSTFQVTTGLLHSAPHEGKVGILSPQPRQVEANMKPSLVDASRTHLHVYCSVKIFGKEFQAVLDTGYTSSLVTESLAQDLDLIDKLLKCRGGFITASGEKVSPLGLLPNLPIRIGHVSVRTDVMVAQSHGWTLLLGMDFMTPLQMDILLTERRLSFRDPRTKNVLSWPLSVSSLSLATFPYVCNMIEVRDDEHYEQLLQRLLKGQICCHCFEEDHASSQCPEFMTLNRMERPTFSNTHETTSSQSDGANITSTSHPRSILQRNKEPSAEGKDPTTIDSPLMMDALIQRLDSVSAKLDIVTSQVFFQSVKHKRREEMLQQSQKTPPVSEQDKVKFPYNVRLGEELTAEQRRQVRHVLLECKKAFKSSKPEFGFTDLITHTIDTGEHAPVRIPLYHNSRAKEELIQHEVDKMLEAGIVSPSSNPWSAPVVLVPKKDEHGKITDKKRVCIDYRQFNKLTKKDSFPMPLIDDMLDRLGQFDSYCLVDLKSAYWQIKMDPSSKGKTAFATKKGLYEFNRMAMGLKNAPASFQRLMNRVLAAHSQYAQPYFDDIMIMGKGFDDTLKNLKVVLEALIFAGLLASPEKTFPFMPYLNYLGFRILKDVIIPNLDKTACITSWPQPHDKKSTLSFLNFGLYYKKWIEAFAAKMSALYDVTGATEWRWTAEQEKAFRLLKECLLKPPILRHPNFALKFIVQTDWQPGSIAAILAQRDTRKSEKRPDEFVVAVCF